MSKIPLNTSSKIYPPCPRKRRFLLKALPGFSMPDTDLHPVEVHSGVCVARRSFLMVRVGASFLLGSYAGSDRAPPKAADDRSLEQTKDLNKSERNPNARKSEILISRCISCCTSLFPLHFPVSELRSCFGEFRKIGMARILGSFEFCNCLKVRCILVSVFSRILMKSSSWGKILEKAVF